MAASKDKKAVKSLSVSAVNGTPEEKKKALDEALKRIKKDYGKGAVMRLGEQTAMNMEASPAPGRSLTWQWTSASLTRREPGSRLKTAAFRAGTA